MGARFRRNLLAHGTLPKAPFFLIATPEHMYFWRQDQTREEEPPQFTLDATRELKPYFERFEQAPETTGGQTLELILTLWLFELTRAGASSGQDDDSRRWLSDSGLLHALQGAHAAVVRSGFDLAMQDSFVLASVVLHLADTKPVKSCFLNRNAKDFDDPNVREALESFGCKFFGRFDHGLGYIEAQLRNAG
jgi:hypothetical protein